MKERFVTNQLTNKRQSYLYSEVALAKKSKCGSAQTSSSIVGDKVLNEDYRGCFHFLVISKNHECGTAQTGQKSECGIVGLFFSGSMEKI